MGQNTSWLVLDAKGTAEVVTGTEDWGLRGCRLPFRVEARACPDPRHGKGDRVAALIFPSYF